MKVLQHDYDCDNQSVEYYTSLCSAFCDYAKAAVADCVDEGQHFRQIVSSGGQDVCFNCGSSN